MHTINIFNNVIDKHSHIKTIVIQFYYYHYISLLPSNVRMRSPVCGFHSLILLSCDPEAIVLPSGENATETT